MNERSACQRFSAPELAAVDHKARKRIEELFVLTDEIIQTQNDSKKIYDTKLYRKYKHLKEINKKLQEKLIHQHCSGCNCHAQSGVGTTQATVTSTSTRDPVVQKKRKTISFVELDTPESQDEDRKTILESSVASSRSASTSTEESGRQTTANNQTSDRPDSGMNYELPRFLQRMIDREVQNDPTQNGYLLNIVRCRTLREYLCNRSTDSYGRRPGKASTIAAFIRNYVSPPFGNFNAMRSSITAQLYRLHQAYVVQCMRARGDEDTIGMRTTHNERQAKNKAKRK